MKNILILGAGQSTPYLINYMLRNAKEHDWFVTVCDRDYNLAQSRVQGFEQYGIAVEFDVTDEALRHRYIQDADIVINLLSPAFQFMIAQDCVNFGKHVITASYANLRISDLHKDALRKGVLILNEMGLDPGIDHMSAISMINKIREKGGIITKFISYGSGIPAPEVLSNPFRYCITWNPRNVVMAGGDGAQYMENGKIKILSQDETFRRTWDMEIPGVGRLEAYPNRDSLIYIDIFGFKKVQTMIRGTLRYPGWSETWSQIIKLGIPNETMVIPHAEDMTYAEFTEMFIPLNQNGRNLRTRVARYLNISPTGKIMENLDYLGLFSDEKIGKPLKTAAEVMTDIVKNKMPLPEGGRDMVILAHDIEVEYPNDGNKKEKILSTMIEYGEPNGFTAISKTVGLPAAIAAKLVLTGELPITGAHIPTHPAIYTKILKELGTLGIKFTEKVEEI